MSVGPFPVADGMERLRTHAPLIKLVGTAADLRTALDQKPRAVPAAYLVCEERGEPAEYTGPIARQKVSVVLQLVLFVRNFGSEHTGSEARQEMDQLIAQSRSAFVGWAPGDAFDSTTFQAGRDESYSGGFLVSQQIFRSAYRFAHQVLP